MEMIEVRLPYRLESPNRRGHWAAHHTRNKKAKLLLYTMLKMAKKRYSPPVSVEITREGPKHLDDDNMVAASKNLRDNIADWIIPGLAPGQADDAKRGIVWKYSQRKARQWCVIVKILPIIETPTQAQESQCNASHQEQESVSHK